MTVLDGKIASQKIKTELKEQVELLIKTARPPHLAAVLIGNDGASETYVASKIKNCGEIGFQSSLIRYEDSVSENNLLQKLHQLNQQTDIDGILVQLPLPKHINEEQIINAIDPDKDVDGFHPVNSGGLVQGLPTFIPATPYGIILLLDHFKIQTKGKHAVIIGRSNIVGRPISILLSSNRSYGNCTVTLCHSQTPNIEELSRQADILVAALGKPGFVKASMVKPGAVVIDVGITRVEDPTTKKGYRISGDVNFDDVAAKASAITPVPGGVGVMTIAALLKNTMRAYLSRTKTDLRALLND
jgi:methylenetetrahydrofolate dehydrogenase (NADP+)/methenyltetrahydrofolate cyclohydrolase